MIIRCTCEHEFQDKKYGKKMRVHTHTRKQDGKIFRCTICEKEKLESGEEIKSKK